MTSRNIAKTFKFEESVFYKAHCSCGHDEHIHSLILEKEAKTIHLTMYANTFLSASNFIQRIKKAFHILCNGEIKYEAEFLFDDKQQIQDYIDALAEGIKKLEGKSNG